MAQENLNADDLHHDPAALFAALFARAEHALPEYPTGPPNFLHSLDPFQAAAAAHFTGPVRVLAPAGSGKTRTLTARIAALQSRGIAPEAILALAFNTKAAEEMGERLHAMGIPGVQTRTFHSLGYEILRQAFGWAYSEDNERILDARAVDQLGKSLNLPTHAGLAKRALENGLVVLREAKSGLRLFSAMQVYDGEYYQDVAPIFRRILEDQTASGLVGYSDMIYFALRALIENGALRKRRQDQHIFLLVDEFQDLNAAQMLFLRILAFPQNNLFVVGDDDQLIYAWRGAQVDHILSFNTVYPNAASIVLATNYRSGSRIVRHARWLIENNPKRVEKDIRPAEGAPSGRIDIALAETPALQAQTAVEWILAERNTSGRSWEDFGLLYRTNREAEWLTAALDAYGIPFTLAGPAEPDIDDPEPEILLNKVTLMTIHKSKGKEFPCVVYFNLSRRGGTTLNEQDERRVVYVGITRAKERLFITADSERPSQFLNEAALNPNFSDYAALFLQRRLNRACRQVLFRRRFFRLWARALLLPTTPGNAPEDLFESPDIEPYYSEIRFRKILGVRIEP